MKSLLEFMLKGILGDKAFEVSESEDNGRIIYSIKTDDENKGLIIGKGGHMINTLRQVLKVPATLEKKAVNLQIEE